MRVRYSTKFKRMFRKLSHIQQKSAVETLMIFEQNPFLPSLRNHKLHGSHEGARAIEAGYDLRIVYREEDGHAVVLMIAVGTHDQVY
ncbi:type II toxin-antitoxin system mRNA interferase toxin, RelE/StbE family [Candidatus Peregrinibacteria bacterium]|nr:type II toxin-antitoxin system mRNA interferase toxin, RelE/StbE family [Candidatus Peregrinibacteria bacterium]